VKKAEKPVHVPDLFKLWNSDRTTTQVHQELGITYNQLVRLVAQHKLGKKPRVQARLAKDPTPEEIAERAAECRRKRKTAVRVSATSHGSRIEHAARWTAPVYSYSEHTGIFKPMR
jgi:hypothetical protein